MLVPGYAGVVALRLPSDESCDHGEGVYEAVGQNAGPEVAFRQDKDGGGHHLARVYETKSRVPSRKFAA